MEITPIVPTAGQKFSWYFDVYLKVLRYLKIVIYLSQYFSRHLKLYSVEPCGSVENSLRNTGLAGEWAEEKGMWYVSEYCIRRYV